MLCTSSSYIEYLYLNPHSLWNATLLACIWKFIHIKFFKGIKPSTPNKLLKGTGSCNTIQSDTSSEITSHCNRFFQNAFYKDLQWTIQEQVSRTSPYLGAHSSDLQQYRHTAASNNSFNWEMNKSISFQCWSQNSWDKVIKDKISHWYKWEVL